MHVSWLTQADPMTLTTPGAWVATETSRLEDYLDERFDVRLRDHWNWFRQAREGDFWGRLYGVQALVCRIRPATQERDERRVDFDGVLQGLAREAGIRGRQIEAARSGFESPPAGPGPLRIDLKSVAARGASLRAEPDLAPVQCRRSRSDEEKTMSNGRRRSAPPPSRATAPSRVPGRSPSSPGIDINDPLNTRRIVQQFVGEQMAREAAPVREWLDANVDLLRGVAMPALLARVRRDVPEARELPDIQIEAIIREWTNLRGISIPRVSLIPLPGIAEIPPPPSGPSFADSELASAIRGLLSIPTSIEIARPHGRTEIGVSGATVELISGASRVGGSISWGGTMGLFTQVGGVRFEGSLSAERWSMTVSFPPGTPTPDLSRLGEIFRERRARLPRDRARDREPG